MVNDTITRASADQRTTMTPVQTGHPFVADSQRRQ